jgi:hypothetical protein
MSTGTDKRKAVCSFAGMVLGPNDVEFTQLRLHISRPGKRKGVGRNTSARSLRRVGAARTQIGKTAGKEGHPRQSPMPDKSELTY